MSELILKGLKNVCLDSTDEKLYIANSPQVCKMVVQLFMSDFYPSIHADSKLLEATLKGTKMTKEQ